MKFNYRYDAKKGKIIKESLLKEDATLLLAAGLGALVGAILGMTASKYVGAFSVEGAKELAKEQKDVKETIKKEIDSSTLTDQEKADTKKLVEEKFNESAENISTISNQTSDQAERAKKFNQEFDSLFTAISTALEEKRILTDTIKKILEEELAKQKKVIKTQTVGGDQAEQLKNQIMEEVITPEATRTATEKLVGIGDGGSDSIKEQVVDTIENLSRELDGEKRKAVEDAVEEYEYTDDDFKNQLITIVQSGSVKPPTPPPADSDQAPEATQTPAPPESPTTPPADEPADKPQGPSAADTIQKLKELNRSLTIPVIEQNIDTYISGVETLSKVLEKAASERQTRNNIVANALEILSPIEKILRDNGVYDLQEAKNTFDALRLAQRVLIGLNKLKGAIPNRSQSSEPTPQQSNSKYNFENKQDFINSSAREDLVKYSNLSDDQLVAKMKELGIIKGEMFKIGPFRFIPVRDGGSLVFPHRTIIVSAMQLVYFLFGIKAEPNQYEYYSVNKLPLAYFSESADDHYLSEYSFVKGEATKTEKPSKSQAPVTTPPTSSNSPTTTTPTDTNAITEDNVPVCEACLYQYMLDHKNILTEAKYHGKSVQLGKPSRGDVKKYKVFVKDPQTGNIKKVNFGDPNMEIRRDNPNRRKNFRARHNCDNPGPRTKARYWSCRFWSKKPVSKMVEEDQEIKESIQRMKEMAGLVED